ncbi:ABC transporter family substrate-binding protein [Streptomyces alkaliphilus]|uniref:ABC transporter family substrate-binding protein n=1 Tax=Streptomyces alkaliphilus TaxID=1472722 RepID=A0A7W3TAK2_9ACTN|nr:ABC transporter substrate-binding protein [Streptomyces alkaliphilus]MBB0243306.1 ABC transporter family substrate-binding protein [Streptomyces alkaliphilus]
MTRFGRTSKLVAAALGGALVLSACSSDDSNNGGDTGEASGNGNGPTGSIYVANDQEYDSYNNTVATGNSLKNSVVNLWVTTGFWHFGEDGSIQRNTEFGTYELTSEDPLTVEYTINEDAVWSDGVPIDCNDVTLWWVQQGAHLTTEREVDVLDDEGEPTGETELQEQALFSAIGTGGIEDVQSPGCEGDEKTFTLVYDRPYADWESNGPSGGNGSMMPAHVVAEQGGFDSVEDFTQAILDEDVEALEEAATFFNNGWTIQGSLPDEALIPSSGPFKLSGYEAGSTVTISYNENYWGEAPGVAEVVYRLVPGTEQPQALQNGDVQIIQPQPDADIKEQLQAMPGVVLEEFDQYVYEHLDFNFDSGSLADDLRLREAFALCVPRDVIVQRLINPIAETAEPQDVRNVAPFEENYQAAVEYSGGDQYGQADIEAARDLLEEADAVGTTVRLGAIANNQRRENTAQLIKESCDEAGFDIQPYFEANFFDLDGGLSQNTYDVAMYAWVGSAQVSGWNSTFRSAECTPEGKGNNNGCYSNEELDEILSEILVTTDLDAQAELVFEVERILWEDQVTIPLFAHPGLLAYADNLENVKPSPAQDSYVWNQPEWRIG